MNMINLHDRVLHEARAFDIDIDTENNKHFDHPFWPPRVICDISHTVKGL